MTILTFWLRGEDNKLVATGFLDVKYGRVEAIFTLPQYRGQSLATIILNAIIIESRKRNFSELTLSSTPNAQSFYEKHGFKLIERTCTRSGIARRELVGIEMLLIL